MFITVIILLAISVLTSLVAVQAHKRLSARLKQYEIAFLRFMTPAKEGEQSEFGIASQQLAEIFANELYIKVKAGMMGQASVQARDIKAVEGALALDGISETSPLIGEVIGASPRLRDLVKKRPGLVAVAQQFLSQMGAGQNKGNGRAKYGR